MTTQQPEALRWAGILQHQARVDRAEDYKNKAAAELRRLHESNTELLAALKYLTEYSQQHGVMPAALTTARAAINKAERTTP